MSRSRFLADRRFSFFILNRISCMLDQFWEQYFKSSFHSNLILERSVKLCHKVIGKSIINLKKIFSELCGNGKETYRQYCKSRLARSNQLANYISKATKLHLNFWNIFPVPLEYAILMHGRPEWFAYEKPKFQRMVYSMQRKSYPIARG